MNSFDFFFFFANLRYDYVCGVFIQSLYEDVYIYMLL